jgi:preprotein translocase subunit SecY
VWEERGVGWFTIILAIGIAMIVAVVFVESGQRRIPVQFAKRVVGRRMYGGQSTYIPLKVNQSGVIPVIFASSLLSLPALVAQFNQPQDGSPPAAWAQWVQDNLTRGDHWIYMLLYVALILFFTFFYVSITFNPTEVADNMKKYGGFIPGVRPGKKTAEYIDRTLTRITLPGALFLALISVLPDYLIRWFNVPFYFGGTSLLIVVGVALDTVRQMESHLLMRNYEGFLKKSKSRSGAFARS